jgi:hypothetical protein
MSSTRIPSMRIFTPRSVEALSAVLK